MARSIAEKMKEEAEKIAQRQNTPPEEQASGHARDDVLVGDPNATQSTIHDVAANVSDQLHSGNPNPTDANGNPTDSNTSLSSADIKLDDGKTMKEILADHESDLRKTMRANGIFMPEDMKMNEEFYRYPRIDPFNYVDGAREYLFFTKTDLPLLKESLSKAPSSDFDPAAYLIDPASKVPYFADLILSEGYRKSVFSNLCYSRGVDPCPFMRILTNRKSSNMDIPDIQVDELETAVNMFGSKILYPKSSTPSDEGVDFTVEFEDTRFAEIYHLWKVYDLYRQLKWMGVLGPSVNQGNRSGGGDKGPIDGTGYDAYNPYTYYKILYDHFSVYKFLVATDGTTILYAAKATGVYARSINRSAFSEIPDKGPLKITIGFKVSGWFDDSFPDVIADFNWLVRRWLDKEPSQLNFAPIYDDEIGYVSQELVRAPFIIRKGPVSVEQGVSQSRDTQFCSYHLVWTKIE